MNMNKEKCIICGRGMSTSMSLVLHKNRATTCHIHQNYSKDTLPGSHSCGYECHFKEPYGFVPEVGCPTHDK